MSETNTVAATPEAAVQRVVLDGSSLELTAEGEPPEIPTRIQIVPWGEVRTEAGTFLVDEKGLAAAQSAFEAHGTELPIDYEHQTLGGAYSSPSGQAPAAGWIRRLILVAADSAGETRGEEPGLWAEVSWTPEGRSQLAGRAYRYLSPVALIRRSDRRLIGLHSAALTNKPAIPGMHPLVNKLEREVPAVAAALKAIRASLDLEADAPDAVVLETAQARLAELTEASRLRRAAERVASATRAGKLTDAQQDWALSLAQRDPAEFDRWVATAPAVVPLGRTVAPDSGDRAPGAAERSARAEWRQHRDVLEKLCSEDAYAADAVRAGHP